MNADQVTRRGLLQAAGTLPFVIGAVAAEDQPESPTPEPFPENAAAAIERLKEGNRRFASGRMRHAHQAADWRKHLVGGQQPFATILACSDSRVPPELVFDQGFGDLFVIRVAGNVISEDVVGSIQYAVRHLHTPLILVLGHQSCGAVTAAVATLAGKDDEPEHIAALVKLIEPGLKDVDPELKDTARISACVEANVRWSLRQLATLPEGKRALENNLIELAGAVYELSTGTVRVLKNT